MSLLLNETFDGTPDPSISLVNGATLDTGVFTVGVVLDSNGEQLVVDLPATPAAELTIGAWIRLDPIETTFDRTLLRIFATDDSDEDVRVGYDHPDTDVSLEWESPLDVATFDLGDGEWHFLEVQISGSGGYIELRIDETVIARHDDTIEDTYKTIWFYGYTDTTINLDSVYVADDATYRGTSLPDAPPDVYDPDSVVDALASIRATLQVALIEHAAVMPENWDIGEDDAGDPLIIIESAQPQTSPSCDTVTVYAAAIRPITATNRLPVDDTTCAYQTAVDFRIRVEACYRMNEKAQKQSPEKAETIATKFNQAFWIIWQSVLDAYATGSLIEGVPCSDITFADEFPIGPRSGGTAAGEIAFSARIKPTRLAGS